MAKSIRSKAKRKFRAIKRKEVFVPVEKKRQENIDNRLLVNTFLNKPTGLDAIKMVIEGEAPSDILASTSAVKSAASGEKRPFSFIERTWEVQNPTEKEIEEAKKAKEAVEQFEKEEAERLKQKLGGKSM